MMQLKIPGRILSNEQKPSGICIKTVLKRLNLSLNEATGKVWKNNNKRHLIGKGAKKMLRSVKEIYNYVLEAEDGEIGRCKDFLFDGEL